MHNEKITLERIQRFIERNKTRIHPDKEAARVEYFNTPEPVPFARIGAQVYQPIPIGHKWGMGWSSAWFRIHLIVGENFAGKKIGLWFDCDGEACVFKDGKPWQGLTPKVDWYHNAAKYYVPLSDSAIAGEEYVVDIEAAANDLFGSGKDDYHLRECALVSLDESLRDIVFDFEVLFNLAQNLSPGSVRRQRIIHSLNQALNHWNTDRSKTVAILKDLLAQPANASALTAFSVGHAHLDLAWLWPVRETKRKGGRTFANALRLLERYPGYVFGASQAQLYQWIKDIYPGLWDEVCRAVKRGRWEVQGASWVEFDTNLISGESIIRQFMHGRRFFQQEFGIMPDVLWLPDCFGFSGNLPQLMQGCGVSKFMTQKLSWNESNVFPHHLYSWQGIDGSEVLAHQLPTNDYNFSNQPSAFLQTEQRFAQSGFCDSFLNLYGIGDGGGGPTLNHIEYGIRQQDLEGICKFRFARSEEFWHRVSLLDKTLLPKMYGELYLEFHRGTYTTQALMKKNNRLSEQLLGAAEFASVLAGTPDNSKLDSIWEDTLLLQFHDIIPGSSIGKVYEDAHTLSDNNHARLRHSITADLQSLADGRASDDPVYMIMNPGNWALHQWCAFPIDLSGSVPHNVKGEPLPYYMQDNSLMVFVQAPAWGCTQVTFKNNALALPQKAETASLTLENKHLIVRVTERGSISSIYCKALKREILRDESNILRLWEDEPNNWGAWDINHFYRETTPLEPLTAELNKDLSIHLPGLFSRVVQDIVLDRSTIRQSIELREDEPFIRIRHEVDWKQSHQMLRVHFLPDVESDTATYEIQFGVIKRSAKPCNAWDLARFEVPAHRFADLSRPDFGCALLSKDKYGYRVVGNEMELNLLRSPADVDPHADIHTHEYSYAFYPHLGDYEHSDVLPIAHKFSSDLHLARLEALAQIPGRSLFELESGTVKLEAVKPAEAGDGTVLRLFEYSGSNVVTKLKIGIPFSEAWLCTMLEEPLERVETKHEIIELSLRPFEVKTLYLRKI